MDVCVCVRVRPCVCTASTCYLLSHVTVTCMCSLYRVNGKTFALHQHTTLSHLMHTMTQCFITCTKQYKNRQTDKQTNTRLKGLFFRNAPNSRQTTTPTPHCSIFMGQMLFLMATQQWQSIQGNVID